MQHSLQRLTSESTPTRDLDSPEYPADRPTVPVAPYETQLSNDPRWALAEGSSHFDEKSKVFVALHRICVRLKSLEIPFVVVGGMALFRHGFRRFTEDVDLLVTRSDLKRIHKKLSGLGYLPPHRQSKHLRDTELGVRIEFLTTGDYPGDGKPKPVAFPDPQAPTVKVIDGIPYLDLPKLVELKLASGMTNDGRVKDLADVQELIKLLNLPKDFSDRLDPYVKEKFIELWMTGRKRYVTLWRNKWLTGEAKSIEEMISMLRSAAEQLEAMRRDGVMLESTDGVSDDYAHLVCTDPKIAEKYGMIEEDEFWGLDEEEEDESDDGKTE